MMDVPAVASIPVPVPVTGTPFSTGRSIRETFAIWRENLGAFALVSILLQAPNLVVTLLQRGQAEGAGSPSALSSLGAGLAYLAFASLAAGALTHGTFQALAGRRPMAGELLSASTLTFWRVFAVTLNASLRMFLWSLLLVVPGIAAACRYFVAVPAAVATRGASSSDALARSAALTAGHRWSIFLLVAVAYGIPFATGLGLVVWTRGEAVPPVAVDVATWVVSAVLGSLADTASAVAFHHLRVEREGATAAELESVFE